MQHKLNKEAKYEYHLKLQKEDLLYEANKGMIKV